MKKFSILALVIAVICAAVCSVKLWFEYELWALLCYAAILFALPFSSFMHELGHMLFGAFAKIKAVPKFSLFGSSSCMLIPKTDENLRKRLIATACGGLAVNFVFILLGIVGLFVSRCAFLTVFLPASVYLFLLNCQATEFSGSKTDGLVIRELVENSDTAKVTLAVMTVQARVLKGVKIQDIDEKLLFGLPVIPEDEPAFISLTELKYEYFKAKGDEEQAAKELKRFEDLKEYLQ